MLKIAIIGCGKIADSHASQIARIPDCGIAAVCDQEEMMARQFGERFAVPGLFTEVEKMLREIRPDVVHITTPPQSHFELAQLCLRSGCHVYVEKPFTLWASEAEQLCELAQSVNLKITAGHDDQYSHCARRMRQAVRAGVLGGSPVHMESIYCYDLSEPGYARALLGDRSHWVRRLPGGLLQNIISHGIARIAEWLTTPDPLVIAHGFTSPLLRGLGETGIIDELRVIINEQERTTAYFTFSSQMRPCLHALRLYGPKNGLELDEDHQTLIRLDGHRMKSFAEKFVPPVRLARQYLGNMSRNVGLFARHDFHMKSGMKFLFESFYSALRRDEPPPIPYPEILRTARIMEAIFEQLRGSSVGNVRRDPVGKE